MRTTSLLLAIGIAVFSVAACRSEKAPQKRVETPSGLFRGKVESESSLTKIPINDFDLVASDPKHSADDNGILLDPTWHWQTDHQGLPDSRKCSFEESQSGVSLGDPPCTADTVTFDEGHGLHQVECSFSGGQGKLHGHANWRLVTDTGFARWHDHSLPDQDYTLVFAPVHDGGLLKENNGVLEVEFNSTETIDRFKNEWWLHLRQMVEGDDRIIYAVPRNMNEVHQPPRPLQVPQALPGNRAIITGLFGIDIEHGAHSEIHPVLAMAIETLGASDTEEGWAVFVRDRGNEGWCSRKLHQLTDLANGRYSLVLPWKPGASGVTVHSTWDKSSQSLADPTARADSGKGVVLQFDLSDSSSAPMFDGLVSLTWTMSQSLASSADSNQLYVHDVRADGQRAVALLAAADTGADLNEPEQSLSAIVHNMDLKARFRLFKEYSTWANRASPSGNHRTSDRRPMPKQAVTLGGAATVVSPHATTSVASPRVVDVEVDSAAHKHQLEGDLILCRAIVAQESKVSQKPLVAACRTELQRANGTPNQR